MKARTLTRSSSIFQLLANSIRKQVLKAAGTHGFRKSIDIGVGKDVTFNGYAVTLLREQALVVEDKCVSTIVGTGLCAECTQREVIFCATALDVADVTGIDILTFTIFQACPDSGEDGLAAVATVPAFVAEIVQDDVLEMLRCPRVVITEDVEVHSTEEIVSEINVVESTITKSIADFSSREFSHKTSSDDVFILSAKCFQDVLVDYLGAGHFVTFGRAPIDQRRQPLLWDCYIWYVEGFSEKLGHVLILEASNSAPHPSEEESVLWMIFGVLQEFIDIGLDL